MRGSFPLGDTTLDALGRPLSFSFGNGASSTYQYDPSTTRLESARTSSPVAGTVVDLGYTFTPEGYVQSITDSVDPSRSQSFSYDSLGRLLSAQGAYGSQTYRYDPLGNLVQKGSMALDYTVGPSTTGGPHAVKSAGSQTFEYDTDGNMTRMGTKVLAYNGFNRLYTVQENGQTLSSNHYDAFGRRTYHASPTRGVTSLGDEFDLDGQNGTKYIFVGALRIAERTAPYDGFVGGGCGMVRSPNLPWSSGAGDTAVYALLLLSLELARRAARLRRPVYAFARIGGVGFLIVAYVSATVPGARALPMNADSTVRPGTLFYVSDHLQSTTVLLDETGAVVRRVSYDPWGAIVSSTGSVDLEDKFTGQRLDPEAGLYYYGARYYAPGVGRFVQADTLVPEPFDPQSFNRYSYALDSPTNFTDPTGNYSIYDECPSCVGGGGGGGGFGFGFSFSFGSGGVSSLICS